MKSASADEAAAIAAAVARFEAEFAAAPSPAPAVSPWHRAALYEGVNAKETAQEVEGESKWLS